MITGTGFVNGATVSFIKQSTGCGGFGAISANNVTVVGSQTITATSPAVSAAAPYYVYVHDPVGAVELLSGLHLHRLTRSSSGREQVRREPGHVAQHEERPHDDEQRPRPSKEAPWALGPARVGQ